MTTKKELEKENLRLKAELKAIRKELARVNDNYETALVFERRKQQKIDKLEKANEVLEKRVRKLENALNALKSALIAKGIYKETVKEVA